MMAMAQCDPKLPPQSDDAVVAHCLSHVVHIRRGFDHREPFEVEARVHSRRLLAGRTPRARASARSA